MFSSAPMRKVNIFVSEENILDLTIALGRLEVLHLDEAEVAEGWESSTGGYWSEQANRYASLERRLRNSLDTLGVSREGVDAPDQLVPREDARVIEEKIRDVEEELDDWQERKRAAKRARERLELVVEGTRLLSPLEISMEALQELDHLHLAIGTIPREDLSGLQMAIFRIPFVIIPTIERRERVLIFAATTQDNAAIMDLALRSAFFEPLELPKGVSGSPDEVLADLEKRLQEVEERLAQLEEERRQMAEARGDRLLEWWRRSQGNAQVTGLIDRFGRHGETNLIVGWVPERDLDGLIKTVSEVTEGEADIEILEPRPSPQRPVPTLLQNPPFLKPFERIVSTFGFPEYDEIDPTVPLALTFVLMYGMMFGDVGHGLLLFLAGVWFFRREGVLTSLAPLMLAAGASGTLFGFLYGSLFGREDILPHIWLSPIEDILQILIVSIAGGAALLSLGFILHLISAWQSHEWGSLFFNEDGLAGFVLYLALLGGGVALAQSITFPVAAWALLLLTMAVLILLQEPLGRLVTGKRPILESGWAADLVQSLFELFETVISYFTNSLSFVRLGAFAIAHAGLSQVVLILSEGGSGLWRWLIILLGAVVIVGFEGLIVGIQTLRLEYYEFFGKFYRGGGLAFKPFRLLPREEA